MRRWGSPETSCGKDVDECRFGRMFPRSPFALHPESPVGRVCGNSPKGLVLRLLAVVPVTEESSSRMFFSLCVSRQRTWQSCHTAAGNAGQKVRPACLRRVTVHDSWRDQCGLPPKPVWWRCPQAPIFSFTIKSMGSGASRPQRDLEQRSMTLFHNCGILRSEAGTLLQTTQPLLILRPKGAVLFGARRP